MDYAAIDLHKTASQIRILRESGEVVDCRIPTTRDRLRTLFEPEARMRVLIEAATESEWVAQLIESLGHEVIVADTNYMPMYGERSRRVKTDRRDVTALAEACQRGLYRPAHRRSMTQWAVQWHLGTRGQLIAMRTRSISLVRTMARMAGVHLSMSGNTDSFASRVEATELPEATRRAIAPLLQVLPVLNAQIALADAYLAQLAHTDPAVQRLMTLPGIGPVTATAFVAALDDVTRFRSAGQVTSYLGLVPREYSSGELLRRGRIVPSAHPRVQMLLVEAAWRIWRMTNPQTRPLRDWMRGVAQRRSKRIAAVALARRLARILFAMWRDEADYAVTRIRDRRPAAA
jgi:transposase